MKNRKGFTLVELLAVIVILGIIALIAVPNVLGTLNKSKGKLSQVQKETILSACKNYVTANVGAMNDDAPNEISIDALHSGGFLESSTYSDLNGGSISACVATWDDSNKQYTYALK